MKPTPPLLRRLVDRAAAAAGLRVTRRRPENRFDAMGETLAALASRGYAPRVVIDGGSNVGQWAGTAHQVFPDAAFHLVEPQPGCHPALEALGWPRLTLHKTALTAPGQASVRMITMDDTGHGTGSFVARPGEFDHDPDMTVPAATLDALFASRVTADDRVLLKLDLEGHEREALDGARALLRMVEVLVLEVRFYDFEQSGRGTFGEMVEWLAARGFALYDVAALGGRPSDGRLKIGDVLFVRAGTPLVASASWE
ncbi:MAG: FkbM family methyltransferase [Vicinamibacterales bacterium]